MPWKIQRNFGDCNGYAVVKEGTDQIEGCHATRAAAEAQQRALYASENKSIDEGNERRGKRRNEMHKRSVVENHPDCNGQFGVIGDHDGELKGCYPTRSAAEEAVRQHDMGSHDGQGDHPEDGMHNVWGGAFSPKK